MLIRCPTCASGYDLDPEVLSHGRILRCANCRDAWVHRGEPDGCDGADIDAAAVACRLSAVSTVVDAVPSSRVTSSWRRLPPLRLPAGAGASLLAASLLLGGTAAVACKARLVASFPPSEAVFAALGLPVNLSGLAIGDLRSTVASGDGPPTLTLEGRITNLRPDATPLPPLRIAVRDKDRRELYHWTAPAPKAQLAAGETVLFRSRLTAPPRDGHNLAVSFAEAAPERRRVAEATPPDR